MQHPLWESGRFDAGSLKQTRRGPRWLRTAEATKDFWMLWKAKKHILQEAGLSPEKRDGEWLVNWWCKITEGAPRQSTYGDGVKIKAPPGREYLPYQREGIKFAIEREHVLIADEMGLGKTIQALGVLNSNVAIHRALVVCPAGLIPNWEFEAKNWLLEGWGVYRLRDIISPRKSGGYTDHLSRSRNLYIESYDSISSAGSQQWVRDTGYFDVVIFDESHYIKNPKAQRTQVATKLPARRRICLTGTPILNRPIELHPTLKMLDPPAWDNWQNFSIRYCNGHQGKFGWETDGASNTEELHDLLTSTVMIRREKADVLQDLPEKRRQVLPLGGMKEDAKKVADGALDSLREMVEKWRRENGKGNPIPFEEISNVRRALGESKIDASADYIIERLTYQPGKVVVFTHHRSVAEGISERLRQADFEHCLITGEMSPDQRDIAVKKFQGFFDHRVLIGTIGAAGVGYTLTESSHVVFVELPWRPADLSQAEDRCHRIGQESSVLSQILSVPETLEIRIAEAIVEKAKVFGAVIDGQGRAGKKGLPSLFDEAVVDAIMAEAKEKREAQHPPQQIKELWDDMPIS